MSHHACSECVHAFCEGVDGLEEASCRECGCDGLHESCAIAEGWVKRDDDGAMLCEECHDKWASRDAREKREAAMEDAKENRS